MGCMINRWANEFGEHHGTPRERTMKRVLAFWISPIQHSKPKQRPLHEMGQRSNRKMWHGRSWNPSIPVVIGKD